MGCAAGVADGSGGSVGRGRGRHRVRAAGSRRGAVPDPRHRLRPEDRTGRPARTGGTCAMTAGISVDLGSPTPPYEQIRLQISALIAAGGLTAGTRLPAVRSLAADLGLAAGTVARAYKELEQAGLIETRRRNGTVVIGLPAYAAPGTGVAGSGAAVSGAAAAELDAAVERLILAGSTAGLADEELLALLRVSLQRRRNEPSGPSSP